MAARALTVKAEQYGPVRVVAVGGELDVVSADEFTRQAVAAIDRRAERFVVDLSGLRFIDCRGARALAAVTRMAPGHCPVVVRSLRPAVRRLLELLDLNLQRPPDPRNLDLEFARVGADMVPDGPTKRLVRQTERARAWSEQVILQSRAVAETLASTEDNLAGTLTKMAGRRPLRADHLLALSQAARAQAVSIRSRGA
jgi:anti-anti-sigma factor